jgi:hypothetical protein
VKLKTCAYPGKVDALSRRPTVSSTKWTVTVVAAAASIDPSAARAFILAFAGAQAYTATINITITITGCMASAGGTPPLLWSGSSGGHAGAVSLTFPAGLSRLAGLTACPEGSRSSCVVEGRGLLDGR